MKLLDVNVLVYAHREEMDRHVEYRRWLEGVLDSPEGCAVSDLVLCGALRILTHPKIFTPPTPRAAALSYVESIRNHPNLAIVAPGERHWRIFVGLCQKAEARGNLVSDAWHAALAIESGSTWITTDRDYARFPGLRWEHPLAAC